MLLSRYGTVDYIFSMPFLKGMEIIKKAYDKVFEDKLFFRWVTNHEESMPFEEFKTRLMSATSTKTTEETLTEVKDIIDMFNTGVRADG